MVSSQYNILVSYLTNIMLAIYVALMLYNQAEYIHFRELYSNCVKCHSYYSSPTVTHWRGLTEDAGAWSKQSPSHTSTALAEIPMAARDHEAMFLTI